MEIVYSSTLHVSILAQLFVKSTCNLHSWVHEWREVKLNTSLKTCWNKTDHAVNPNLNYKLSLLTGGFVPSVARYWEKTLKYWVMISYKTTTKTKLIVCQHRLTEYFSDRAWKYWALQEYMCIQYTHLKLTQKLPPFSCNLWQLNHCTDTGTSPMVINHYGVFTTNLLKLQRKASVRLLFHKVNLCNSILYGI